MNSNFHFLQPEPTWASLYLTLLDAERWGKEAPAYSLLFCRKALEEWVRWLYDHDKDLEIPWDDKLTNLLNTASFFNLVQQPINRELNLLRRMGNQAAHSRKAFVASDSLSGLAILHRFVRWVVRTYSPTKLETHQLFKEEFVPAGRAKEMRREIHSLQEELSRAKEELLRKDKKIQEDKAKQEKLEADLAATAAIKAENVAQVVEVPTPTLSEAKTRELFIDVLLREAGWEPKDHHVREYPVYGMPNPSQKGYVDYVLWGDDGKPLALVEAKRTSKDVEDGNHQARLYADCLEQKFGRRPIVFLSNGFTHRIIDGQYPRRTVAGFYSKEELEWMHQRLSQRQNPSELTIKNEITNRFYQKEAIHAIFEAFQKNRRRTLLVMATGSGKTRTATSLTDVLQRAGWAKKILFLADRTELVKQALTDGFKAHLPETTNAYLSEIGGDRLEDLNKCRIIGSTYQTIINRIDKDYLNKKRFFGPGFFDLVIVDEAHRSVYNTYGQLFQYFDALYVGLTATPKDEIDVNTYNVFELSEGQPTYAYDLNQAIKDGFLVPYRVAEVPMQIPSEGIRYADLSAAEKVRYEEDFGDPVTGLFPEEVGGSTINNWVFNQDTVDKVLTHLIDHGLKIESGDQLGKTIIFARNHNHAIYIEARFKALYPNLEDHYVQVIDNQTAYASDAITKFKKASSFPQIAISVDMLDTGIDVPELVNLVFFKPVRSKVKFWQMIGRGTRLCPDLFGPKQDKAFFYIFDFCRNFEFFGINPEGVETSVQESISARIFWLRYCVAELLTESEAAADQALRQKLLDSCHADTIALKDNSFEIHLQREHVEFFRKRANWDDPSEAAKRTIRRNLAPLMRYGGHETERQFDVLMLNSMYALLLHDKRLQSYINKGRQLAEALSRKKSVPAVAKKMPLIRSLTEAETWAQGDAAFMEHVREELRELIKFIDKRAQAVVYTNIEDSILSVTWNESEEITSFELEDYRRRMEHWIQAHKNNLTIHKINNNQPITTEELHQLSQLLFRETDADAETAHQILAGKNLAEFIRSTVGLDRAAVLAAFSDFMDTAHLTSTQSHFIKLLMDHLEEKGLVEVGNLYEAPYVGFHYKGIEGVFAPEQVGRIVRVLAGVKRTVEVG